ncbi:Unknown protein, partial [Striga hermonthica]
VIKKHNMRMICNQLKKESYHDACSQDVVGQVDPTKDANDVGSHEVDPTKERHDAGSHDGVGQRDGPLNEAEAQHGEDKSQTVGQEDEQLLRG